MKKIITLSILACSAICLQAQQAEINGCWIKTFVNDNMGSTSEFNPYGNVYIVTDPKERADLYVKMATSKKYATYKVFRCTDEPKKCGEWRFVTDKKKAKFTVKFVDNWEDCTVYYTDNRAEAGFF